MLEKEFLKLPPAKFLGVFRSNERSVIVMGGASNVKLGATWGQEKSMSVNKISTLFSVHQNNVKNVIYQ